MSDLVKKTIDEVRRGRDLEMHLPQLGSRMAENYYRSSLLDYAMNYVVAYESIAEGDPDGDIHACLEILREETENNLLSGFDGQVLERSVERLYEMRKNIIRRMEVLTAYTDMLEVYEYVLNRLEARYLPELPEENLETAVQEIFQYIFDTTDNVVINEKIKEILGQLPVRLTKQKFYDLLCDSLSVYRGSDMSSLELYEYMIRTGAMLYRPEGMGEYYQDLQDVIDMFAGLDYDKLTKEEFESATDALHRAADYIAEEVNAYVTIATAVNSLYVLILTAPYGENEFAGREAAAEIIRITCDAFRGAYPSESDYMDAVESHLTALEGKLEEQQELTQQLEAAVEEARQHGDLIDGLMLRPLYDSLRLCACLRSDSIFADIEEKEQEVPVTDEKLEEVKERLLQDFSEGFAKQNRMVRRAVMAGTLNRMPVFFTGRQETLDYIQNALLSCTNPAELTGSLSMLRRLMGNIYD